MAAIPHPEEAMQRLERCASGRALPPIVIVTGSSDFFRAEAVELLLAAVPPDAELRIVDAVDLPAGGGGAADDGGGDGEGAEVAAAGAVDVSRCPELHDLRGGGLFAKTAFVCVRRGANWWKRHADVVGALAPKIASGSCLVVETVKFDKRSKFAKGLVDRGSVFEFRDLYEAPYDRSRSPFEGELAKWVVRRAAKLGVPLAPEAAWLLVMQVGKQPADLLAELARLRDRLGADAGRRPLSADDLRGRLTCSFESTPFELAEAVLAGDRRRAVRSVQAMFEHGVRGRDGRAMDQGGVFPFATSWLFQSVAAAYEGRLLLDSGVSPRDLAERAGVRHFADRFVEEVRANPAARLRRGLLALHSCQRMARLFGEAPVVLLERFLAQWFDGAPIPTAAELEP
jgi:DNA polymerase III delta subunit